MEPLARQPNGYRVPPSSVTMAAQTEPAGMSTHGFPVRPIAPSQQPPKPTSMVSIPAPTPISQTNSGSTPIAQAAFSEVQGPVTAESRRSYPSYPFLSGGSYQASPSPTTSGRDLQEASPAALEAATNEASHASEGSSDTEGTPMSVGRARSSKFACFKKDSKLITAMSVAYFAFVGLAIRESITLLLHNLDFGITTSHYEVKPGLPADPNHCKLSSNGAGYFVQNALGCMLMAAVARHKTSMNEHLAIGLASGLCGSLTTFATWMGEEAATFLNGYIWQAFVSVLCMLCVSLTSYRFGHFLAGCGMNEEPACFDEHCGLQTCFRALRKGKRKNGVHTRADPRIEVAEGSSEDEAITEERREQYLDDNDWALRMDDQDSWKEPKAAKDVVLSNAVHYAIVFAGFVVIAVYCGIAGYKHAWEVLFDIAYAPAGALLRWWLSLFNKYTAPFPLFTLIANILACVCNGFAGVLEHRESHHVGKAALGAISTGFAGCLSTVSTLVAELRNDTIGGLRMRIFYFLLSFGLAMAVLLPIDTAHC
eukprot:TRINITY_DN39357_c0_g1_i1.p1 TRINITY_DN39357_c0_g1~~TRINITY_DN39357_c0_g1_i1.p1  ORF type:complete len:538 (+),score=59.21 TRINITY_DN39357_c0_g1_i1:79-1692(+)